MTAPVNVVRLAGLSPEERKRCLARTDSELGPYLEKVAPIVAAVAEEGDEALARFTRQFDKAPVTADKLAATPEDFIRARKSLAADVIEAIAFAAGNIVRFHEDQMPDQMWLHEVSPGAFAGDRIAPISSVACYVPRGKGSFPSSVMMTCIPAKIAGVQQIVIVTPPGPDGNVDDATLIAAEAAGVSQVFKCGGYAPEHLQIMSREPMAWLGAFKNAGEILLGEYTPSTLANFVLGPNHVLPTGGWAKTASPLSVFDFMKRTSIGHVTRAGYERLAPHARIIARYEGFDAHANAVSQLRGKLLGK